MTLFKMKDTPRGIIETLRDQAEMTALEIGEAKEAMSDWDAADLIEELMEALQQIADGAPNHQVIAKRAIDPMRRVLENYADGKTGSV